MFLQISSNNLPLLFSIPLIIYLLISIIYSHFFIRINSPLLIGKISEYSCKEGNEKL